MTKGLSFDELYPGTYIKAGEFGGKPVTLTIKAVTREMLSNGSGGEEGAVIVAFEKTDKLFVMNKTNAVCLRAMWGDDSGEWTGHRVTLHPVKDESGLSESGQCIRVKGSPELPKALKFRARLGRKMVTQTLVPTGNGSAPAPVPENVDEDTDEVFGFEDEEPTADPQPVPESTHDPEPDSDHQPPLEGSDDDDVPGRGPIDIRAKKATAKQLAEIVKLRKASGIYEAEYVGLLDEFGAVEASALYADQADSVIERLQGRLA